MKETTRLSLRRESGAWVTVSVGLTDGGVVHRAILKAGYTHENGRKKCGYSRTEYSELGEDAAISRFLPTILVEMSDTHPCKMELYAWLMEISGKQANLFARK